MCVTWGKYRGQRSSLSSQQGCIAFNWSTCGTITSFTQTRSWWQKKTALSLPLLERRLYEETDSSLFLVWESATLSHSELLPPLGRDGIRSILGGQIAQKCSHHDWMLYSRAAIWCIKKTLHLEANRHFYDKTNIFMGRKKYLNSDSFFWSGLLK